MTPLYYLIPAALMAAAVWWFRRCSISLDQLLDDHELAERRRRITGGIPLASPLDAASERIVPGPVRSVAMSVVECAEHAPAHPLARPNGRDMADRLRLECPWLTDRQGLEITTTLLIYAGEQDRAKGNRWLVFTDALAFAAVEFAAVEYASPERAADGGEL